MLTRQERTAGLILAIVVLIVFAGFVILETLGNSNFATPYSPDTPDGTLVVLQGPVEKVTSTRSGGELILRVNGTQVFIPAGAVPETPLKTGDTLVVYGIVQTYKGEKEVMARSKGDIRYVQHGKVD